MSDPTTKPLALDSFDRKIIAILHSEGRLAIADLAERVHLSTTPVARRVRRLEEAGYIKGYAADVSLKALGIGVTAFLLVRREKSYDRAALWQDIARVPQVLQAHVISGEYDLLLEVVSTDLEAYTNSVVEKILGIQGVVAVNSLFALKCIKERSIQALLPTLGDTGDAPVERLDRLLHDKL
jgi:Lrp/AsnC family leucine-responsive transcriptional regulator